MEVSPLWSSGKSQKGFPHRMAMHGLGPRRAGKSGYLPIPPTPDTRTPICSLRAQHGHILRTLALPTTASSGPCPGCQVWLTSLQCHTRGCFGFPEEQGQGES